MSKHKDYTKYSNREQRTETKLVEEVETLVANTEFSINASEPVVEDIPEVVEPKQGIVIDCVKLNVRMEPSSNSEVIGQINASSNLEVYEDESTEEFYKICTHSGVEGYCMKKFIHILP